jgi:hypothetical protein
MVGIKIVVVVVVVVVVFSYIVFLGVKHLLCIISYTLPLVNCITNKCFVHPNGPCDERYSSTKL